MNTETNQPQIKAAAYCRVSTLLGQNPDNQLIPIREFCDARGFTLDACNEYVDMGISGARERRPSLDKLLQDAKRGKFKILVVVALDRLGRNVKNLLAILEELNSLGVKFISLRENIDLSTPQGFMIMTVLGAVAQLEREITRTRIREALAAKKLLAEQTSSGWKCGRPQIVNHKLIQEILSLHEDGLSVREIEKAIDKQVSHSTINKVIKTSKGIK